MTDHDSIWGERFCDDMRPSDELRRLTRELEDKEAAMLINIRDKFYDLPFIDQVEQLNGAYEFLTEVAMACEKRARAPEEAPNNQ